MAFPDHLHTQRCTAITTAITTALTTTITAVTITTQPVYRR